MYSKVLRSSLYATTSRWWFAGNAYGLTRPARPTLLRESRTLNTSVAKEIQLFEKMIVSKLENTETESLTLSEAHELYNCVCGKQMSPKEHGFANLTNLLQSTSALEVTKNNNGIKTVRLRVKPINSYEQRHVGTIRTNQQVTFIDTLVAFGKVRNEDNIFSNQKKQADEVVAIDVERVEQNLSLVQVSTSQRTYVFDAQVLGSQAVFDCLAPLLQNQNALKLIHDLHSESEIFYGRGGIPLRGVLDSQLVYEHTGGGNFHAGFNKILEFFGQPEHSLKRRVTWELNIEKKNPFALRPLPAHALDYAVLDTRLLQNASEAIREQAGDDIERLIRTSEKRAMSGQARWRSICFDTMSEFKLASSELLECVRPADILQPEPLVVHNEIDSLLEILPEDLADSIIKLEKDTITEIVLDKGEHLCIWKEKERLVLGEDERTVTSDDLRHVMESVGNVGSDNRGGLNKQLHRISLMRNREQDVVGMTLRVGRYVTGNAFHLSDLLHSEANILFIGNPGSRKTTMIREVSRILAETENVIIVDTSNEIAGAGDLKHVSVGKARRMFVENLETQRKAMIECIQNHRPDVMVIDEIGRKNEANAARTAASRGVRLIATAHGSFRSLLGNPDTNGLIGGITNVTLGDAFAKASLEDNGNQAQFRKSRAERVATPVFDVVIELGVGNGIECIVVQDTTKAVDNILAEKKFQIQRRKWDGVSASISLQLDRA